MSNNPRVTELLYSNYTKEVSYNVVLNIAATKTYKVFADHLDTSRRVAESTNNIVWTWESSPFGESKATGTLEYGRASQIS